MTLTDNLAPYASKLDAWMSRLGDVIECTSMIWGILRKFENLYDSLVQDETTDGDLFTAILLESHVLMVAAVAVETVMITWLRLRLRRKR